MEGLSGYFAAAIGLLLYILYGMALNGLVGRYIVETQTGKLSSLVISLGAAPGICALQLELLISVFPGRERELYLLTNVLLMGSIILIGRKGIRQSIKVLARFQALLRGTLNRARDCWVAIAIILMVSCAIWVGMTRPLIANDPLEYATVSRIIYRDMDNSFYLFEKADEETGFFMGMSHPLAYCHMLTWHYLLQQNGESMGSGKLISVYFYCLLVMLTVVIGLKRSRRAGLYGGLLMAGVPHLGRLVTEHSIDIIVVFYCCASVYSLTLWRKGKACLGGVVFTAFITALSLNSHSVGILTLAFVCVGVLVFLEKIARWIGCSALILMVSGIVGGHQYVENMQVRGRIIGDSLEVWRIPELKVSEHLRQSRGLNSVAEQVFGGLLQMWTKPHLFGVGAWLFLLALATRGRGGISGWYPHESISLLIVGMFLSGALISVLAGSEIVIKNPRYFMVIQPFIALIGGRTLASVLGSRT